VHPRELDPIAQSVDVRADRQGDAVGVPSGDVDHLRTGLRHVNRRLFHIQRGVDVEDRSHRAGEPVEVHLLVAQIPLHLAHIGLELRHLHWFAANLCECAVAATEADQRTSATEGVQYRNRVRYVHRVAQRY
jgi:hypothetical protein